MATALVATGAVLAVVASAASASLIYNNQPKPLPKNLASIGFEATSTSEFGGQVEFAGTARMSPTVQVTMSSWACQNLEGGANCKSEAKSSFEWPITLNVYAVGAEDEPGALITSSTKTFAIPYRPSASKKCSANEEGVVGYGPECFHGKAFKITFPLEGVTLPGKAIVSVAYNTSHHGYAPTGGPNIGQDSLNLALTEPSEGALTVGADPLPEDVYVNSTWSGMYGSKGTVGQFTLTNEWEGLQPTYKIRAKSL